MDAPILPDDLTNLTDSELEDLANSIAAKGDSLAESDDLTDDVIADIEALADAKEAVDTEMARRADELTALQERREAAVRRFRGEASSEPDADAETAEAAPVEELQPAIVASTKRGTAGLTNRRPTVSAPKETAPKKEFMRATAHAAGVPEGHVFSTPLEVAAAIVKKRMSMGTIPDGVKGEQLAIASGMKSGIEFSIGADAVENFEVLRRVQTQHQSLVASGSYCAPLSPSYDFYRLAEVQNPVETVLPTVQAPRGGIRYIVSPNTTAALAAASNALDISPDTRSYSGSTVQYTSGPKSFATVSCPSVAEREVEAISQIVQFDNLNYRAFPEQVQAFMEDVAVAFASRKEVYYLDFIDTNSTAVTADFGYGASRSVLNDWTKTAVAYRKRHGMRRGATLQVLAPDWAMDAIKLDMALDGQQGLQYWQVSDAQVTAALRERGMDVAWYNDAASTVTAQKFNSAQAAGLLKAWPTTISAYFFSSGTFVRLDGGTLDLGLVRDSTLNRTNDLQLFMEEWIGMAKLGFESIRITSTVKVNGAAPAGVTAAS